MRELDDITGAILDAAHAIHADLGPGLLESVYEAVLAGRLEREGYKVDRQMPIDVRHDGLIFPSAFRLDLLVDDAVIVEVKSVEQLKPVHQKQLLTYLRLARRNVGLLINFNEALLKDGVRRVVNGYRPSASPRLRVNQGKGFSE